MPFAGLCPHPTRLTGWIGLLPALRNTAEVLRSVCLQMEFCPLWRRLPRTTTRILLGRHFSSLLKAATSSTFK